MRGYKLITPSSMELFLNSAKKICLFAEGEVVNYTANIADLVISFSLLIVKSISSNVLVWEKEKRMVLRSELPFKASSTCEPASAPELQALPPDTLMPAMSRLSSSKSDLSEFGKLTLNTL